MDKDFIKRMIKFDTSNMRSYISRILKENRNGLPGVYQHLIDGYMLSIGEDELDIEPVYDKAYERNIFALGHSTDGNVVVYFAEGGGADFYNIGYDTMRQIVEQLISSKK